MSSGSGLDSHAFALLIATGSYQDPDLAKLRSPAGDARELAAVLADPAIGGYETRLFIDEPTDPVKRAIERFLAGRRPEDTLILYLSCHGVKDLGGRLCFATASTEMDLLASTTVSADFIYELVLSFAHGVE